MFGSAIAGAISSFFIQIGWVPATIVLVLLLLFTFYILSEVCEEALEPCLEELSSHFNISHDVACATFLALGSSAPEIFINSIAVVKNDAVSVDVSMGAIFGSALIAFTLIPACSSYVSDEVRGLELKFVPLARDVGFFVLGMGSLIVFSADNKITIWESGFLTAIFGAYLFSMKKLMRYYDHDDDEHHFILPEAKKEATMTGSSHSHTHSHNGGGSHSHSHGGSSANTVNYGSLNEAKLSLEEAQSQREKNTEEEEEHSQEEDLQKTDNGSDLFSKIKEMVIPPFGWKSEEQVKEHWKIIIFISIIYLIFLSEICLAISIEIAAVTGLSNHLLGLVLVAVGAQVDDFFVSITVAKKGEGSSSMANALGSQVFNICLGVGLPFFISSLMRGSAVVVNGKTASSTGVLLFLVIALFLVVYFIGFPYFSFRKRALYREGAVVLCFGYAAAVLASYESGIL